MLRPADALEQRGDGSRCAELADEIHGADVDAEFERGRGDERLQLTALQPIFSVEPQMGGEAAVVGGDAVGAEQFGQIGGDALGQAAGVDEHERRAVRFDQLSQAPVNFGPDFVRHHGFQGRTGKFDREIQSAGMAGIDDPAAWLAVGVDFVRARRESVRRPQSVFAWRTIQSAVMDRR